MVGAGEVEEGPPWLAVGRDWSSPRRLGLGSGGGSVGRRGGGLRVEGEQRLFIVDARAGETGEAARAGRGRTEARVPGRGQAGSADSAAPRRACCLGDQRSWATHRAWGCGPEVPRVGLARLARATSRRARCDVSRPKLFSCDPV
jgi:hypothetical protein